MKAINETNHPRSSEAVPATRTGPERNSTSQPSPAGASGGAPGTPGPARAEANVSLPADASQPASHQTNAASSKTLLQRRQHLV